MQRHFSVAYVEYQTKIYHLSKTFLKDLNNSYVSPAWKSTEHTWHVCQAHPRAAQGCCLEVSVTLLLGIRVSGVPIQGHPSDSAFGTFLENGLQWLGVMIKSRFHTSVDRQSAQRPADSDWEVPGFNMVCLPKIHMLGSWWRISVLEDGVQQVPEMDGVQQEVLRSLKTERMPLEGAKVCLLGLLITTPPLISPSHTCSCHFNNTHHNFFTEN